MISSQSQFLHLDAYGRQPRSGAPPWSCISGVTREGARVPGACRHLRYRGEPRIIFGISPIEAGELASARADQAFDHGRKRRRLRRDGKALLAGVASYPVPRQIVENDAAEQELYRRWRALTRGWLIEQFGAHLKSVVEHVDEKQLHLHYYVVPELLPNDRLDMRDIHPGLRMKHDAAEIGANQKCQDAAYRSGLSRWQDDYWWEVSRQFGHTRLGPRRNRVIRAQRLMERRMEEEMVRQRAAQVADCARFEQEMAQRRADLERERENAMALADARAARIYEEAIAKLRAGCITLKGRAVEERTRRQAAEAEVERLRARLAELESTPAP